MKKLHYMVVDDNTTNNMICNFTIKRFDNEAEIKIFVNPEYALAFIKGEYSTRTEAKPTILFLDVNMPAMSGWEFLDVFLQLDEGVREQFTIYILSSSIGGFTEEAKRYTSIKGFLSKPLNINIIERIIKEVKEIQIEV